MEEKVKFILLVFLTIVLGSYLTFSLVYMPECLKLSKQQYIDTCCDNETNLSNFIEGDFGYAFGNHCMCSGYHTQYAFAFCGLFYPINKFNEFKNARR